MNSWYTVKVKYTKQLDDGRLKRVTEPYLVDAVNFTEAEARIYNEVGLHVKGEFLITGISKTEFADIFEYEDAEDWYKCKLNTISFDADTGKEKKISSNFLVSAHNVKEAYERIQESLRDSVNDFEIPSIMRSPILEIFPYDPDFESDNVDISSKSEAYSEEEESTSSALEEFNDSTDDQEMVSDDAEEDVTSTFEDENERQ